ncbi:receptor-type tyrosine-protein phosphatase eta-like, partial [Silurus meridionalis]
YTVTGLTAGVKYTFTVTAVAAETQTTGAPTQILAFTNPDVASNLTVSSKTTSSVFLTWNEPPGNRSYFTVQWTDGSVKNSSNTSTPYYTVTGLTAGVNYTFTVTAVAADTQTKGSPTQISAFTKPDVLSNLTVSSKNTSSVSLNWNEPNGNRRYFTVQWTNGSGNNIINSSNTYYNVTGLTAGVNYTFTVSAVAADNQTTGSPTQIIAFTNPDVVTNLIVSNKTTSSVSLNWNEPNGNRRSYFTVQWTGGSVNNINNTSDTSYTVTGLTAGVKYIFTVTAVAVDKQTTGSPTQISAFTNPDAVTNLTVSNKTTSSVSLTWNEPPGNKSYFILRWTGGSLNKSINISTTSYNVTGLTAGVNYTFTVTAFAGDGQNGGATTQISAFTNPDIVSNLSVSNKTTSSVSLTWNEPNGYRSYFTVQWNNGSVNNIINSLITSYTVTGLTAGVNYTYTVSAVAADTQTTGSPTQISAFTKPDVVKDLNVIEITTRSLFLNWTEPIGKRSFFKVQWSNNITLNSTTSNTFYNITNLSPGVNYTILISAVAADNITEGGAIGCSVFTKPDIVRNLKTSEVTTTSVFLSWTEPLGKISFFRVQWINSSTTTSATSFNITGLTPGTNYTFSVSAVADDNKTEGSVVGLSICTDPDVASNLTVSSKTTSSVSLTWNEPPGNRSYFTVQWTDGSVHNSSNTSITSYTVTGLTAGVNYLFTVTAVAADTQTKGSPTQISAFTKPDIVRNLKTSEVTTTSVFLSWTEPLGNRSFFRVQWINSSTTPKTFFNITGLTPGTNYTFTVSAVADDNKTEGSVVGLSICTGTSPVFNISCVGPNRTAAALNLTWTNPPGNNQGFNINLNSAFSKFTPFCNPVCNYFISNYLQYFNTYNLTISTLGCGEIGSWDFKCRTDPPVPGKPEDVVIKVTSVCKTAVTLQFSSNLLNSANGPIEAYGVLLSTDPQSNNSKTFLRMTYNDWLQEKTKTYLTVLKLNNNIITKSNMILVEIGNDKGSDVISNEDFKNGPLSNQYYRVALVLFTYLKIRDGLVDIQQSIFSVTPFS